jgi:hypothetical protein
MKYLLVFFLFLNYAFGQDYREASILFNDSTTIKGFGELRNNKIYFKLKQEDKPSEWQSDFAKGLIFTGYGFSEKYEYLKIDKNSKPKLVEVIEEGNVNLYKLAKLSYGGIHVTIGGIGNSNFPQSAVPNGSNPYENYTETFYIKRKNEVYPTDIAFGFKKRAKRYFSDCEIILKKILIVRLLS